MKRYLILPIILVGLLLVACTPEPNIRDDSFLSDSSLVSGDPCGAPCWQDLIPGETAWGVARDTVESNEEFTVIDFERDRSTGEEWVEFAYQDGTVCCRIYTDNGETLSTTFLLLAPQMTVAEVIAQHGDPTYITAAQQTATSAYVTLIYPDTAMVVYAFAENITSSEINGDNDIIGVAYTTPDSILDAIEVEGLYSWEGYGVLGDVIDGEYDLTPAPETDETTEETE